MEKWKRVGVVAVAAMMSWSWAVEYSLRWELRPKQEPPVYQAGEAVTFTARAYADGQIADTGTIAVTITHDGGDKLSSASGAASANGVSAAAALDVPGFLRGDASWEIDGRTVATAAAAAAVEPEKIEPGFPEPADFGSFWKNGLRELAAVPEDAQIEAAPELSNDEVDVFRVSFANVHDKRIYGFLSVPKAEGTYPAIVYVPGAGPASPEAASLRYPDAITLFMNIHSYAPPALVDEAEKAQYMLDQYGGNSYAHIGRDQAESFFFRDAYLGISRAIDYVRRHPKYDGDSLGVMGSSQGGASALILSGLNPDIKFTVANVPALCDHGGYRAGRRPGWPQVTGDTQPPERSHILRAASYTDAANFARRIQHNVVVIAGWIDPVCPPGSVYAAYNVIPSPDKRIIPEYTMSHEWPQSFNTAIDEMRQALRENHRKLAP